MTGLGRVQRGKPFVVAEDFDDEIEFAALTARCERLATAYLQAEAVVVKCVTYDVNATARDKVAESHRAFCRKHLQPGDLPGDAREGGEE